MISNFYFNREEYITKNELPVLLYSIDDIDLSDYSKIIALVDENIYRLHKNYVDNNFKDIILISPYEKTKNLNNVVPILKQLTNKNLDRDSCIIGVGGGVTGDITGFCASIYMRGIDFIQIPTSFMSMSDHIIGKVAISNEKKNVFGSFYSPKYIIIEDIFISSMPRKLMMQGLVEVLKHYFITNYKEHSKLIDKKYFKDIIIKIANNEESLTDRKNVIQISHNIKAFFVKQDPYDKTGVHKALSYGHTFANAIESIDQTINHGEAVLKGMELAAKLSYKLGMLDEINYKHHTNMTSLLSKNLPELKITSKQIKSMIYSFKTDKISSNGKMKFVLLTEIGKYKLIGVEEAIINEFLLKEVSK
ncbi:MAG: 3-dehydroquinate synthase family protein [Candidatus Woesearchaeota archaeon]